MSERAEKKVLKTPTIEIQNNILKYKDSVIQMSCVSQCEIAPMPKQPYPAWTFICILLGTLFCFTKLSGMGIILIIAGCLVIWWIYSKNKELGTYLIFELNSGNTIYFSCNSRLFLNDAQEAVIHCFNDRNASCVINFDNCSVQNSQIGTNNKMEN